MNFPTFQLGDIVALRSHPFEHNLTSVIYSGDPSHISPLMIVAEILLPANTKEEIDSDLSEYKCIWYSSQMQSFEETWLSGYYLKLIEKADEEAPLSFTSGDTVLFRTTFLELGKRKSSFSIEGKQSLVNNKATIITPLLNFSSPVFIVCNNGILNNQPTKSGNKRKSIISDKKVKVKWYNSFKGKFSEYVLPTSCIAVSSKVSLNVLVQFQHAILKRNYLKVHIKDKTTTIISPLRIVYINGEYNLRYSDLIKSTHEEDKSISSIQIIAALDNLVDNSAPVFDFSKTNQPIQDVIDLLQKGVSEKQVVRIKYKNIHDQISIRCLRNFEINSHQNGTLEHYLSGKCMLKSDHRHFNVSRISKAELLSLTWDECGEN